MRGGEIFVPKIPSMKVVDLARAVAPNTRVDVVGIRPGEKLHEVLVNDDEARSTVELGDMYVIQPAEAFWFGREWLNEGQRLPDGFRYASNTNEQWLTVDQLRQIVAPIEASMTEGTLE
jgi:UDP-N-acetylglucosamine 4,6-dehydratase